MVARTPEERLHGRQQQAVEFQMRFHELLTRAAAPQQPAPRPVIGRYIAISREVATAGVEIARRAASRLGSGWRILDRELVETLARELEVSPTMLELMDETRSNWFSDSLLTLLEPHLTIQDSYVAMLRKIMLLAACDGQVIFVGRGAGFMLPRQTGLRVRLIAPRELRLERFAAERHLEPRAAAKLMREMDEDRDRFVRHHFHCNANDPSLYDLVVDSSALGVDGTAELVRSAYELRLAHLEERSRSGTPALLVGLAPTPDAAPM